MLLTLSAFIISYTVAARSEAFCPVRLDSPKTMILLFAGVILYSLILEFARGISGILVSSMVYFGISVIPTITFAEEAKIIFLLRWTIFAWLFSTSFMIFKLLLLCFISQKTKKRLLLVGEVGEEFIKDAEREYEIVERTLDTENFEKILERLHPDLAFFALSGIDEGEVIRLVNICDDKCVRCYFLPSFYGYLKSGRQIEYLGANVLINVHSTPLDDGFRKAVKRTFDIFGSLFLIILTLPTMIFAAIGVKLSSGGPIIFKQRRIGMGGKSFTMLKFRSMRIGNGDISWSTGIDERKTRFGNFLRRSSIDELPQLFNVLLGSMSLVGPRPEIPHFVERFREHIPLYMVKHYVKPGITGLAQIKGLRGDTSIEERIAADIFYIENWSLALDISIILKTPLKMINKSEKYTGNEK